MGRKRLLSGEGIALVSNMIKENYFFELPIYRVTREKYYMDMEKYIENKFSKLNDIQREYYGSTPEKKAEWAKYYREEYGSIWEYNDVIGYIKLYFYGTQVRGGYWSVKAKRIVRTKKKGFYLHRLELRSRYYSTLRKRQFKYLQQNH